MALGFRSFGILPAAALSVAVLLSSALGGEDAGAPPFVPPAGEAAAGGGGTERLPRVRVPVAPEDRRWRLSLDFDYRRRGLKPVRVDDEYHDHVGNVHLDERLDMDVYSSEDVFQTATLGLSLHWRPIKSLNLWAGVRRPAYGKGDHTDIEYAGSPIASPRLEFDNGAAVEVAAGAEWQALLARTGPLRGFGLSLVSEVRAGWGDDVKCPNEEREFAADDDDDLEYEADWQAFDFEVRITRLFPDTSEGWLTAWAGLGVGLISYHETWDGVFEGGDEEEKMEFDYREKNLVFGSLGLRAEKGPFTIDVAGRYGGEYLLHVSMGWRF